MRNILKIFGFITLVCFSFFYTDKVMDVVSEQDSLKIQINELAESYKILPNEAIVTNNTIIPGSNGRIVNIDKSYKKMRKENVFNKNMLVYDTLYPKYRLEDNLDKYVIRGNINKKEVSILFIIKNNTNMEKLKNILDIKNVYGNLFIEYNYLNNNIDKVKSLIKHNLYSYQEEYSYENLIISNNIIKRVSKSNPKYCLSKIENSNNINVCSYSNMNTIIPVFVGNINDLKSKLENGSIILLDTSFDSINLLSYLIDFIKSKGYNIVSLDDLLNESI